MDSLAITLAAKGKKKTEIANSYHTNISVTMSYSCPDCFTLLSAILGWDYLTGKRPTGGRWRCTHCGGKWNGGSDHAVAYVLRGRHTVLIFYGRGGHSYWIQDN